MKGIITMKNYVENRLESTDSSDLARELGVTTSMLSAYKRGNNPHLRTAVTLYENTGVVIHPFSEASLKYELSKKVKYD